MDKAHNLLCRFFRLYGIIRHAKFKQHIRKAHYAKTYLAGKACVFVNNGEGIVVYINYIVKEMDGITHNACNAFVVDCRYAVILRNAKTKVY